MKTTLALNTITQGDCLEILPQIADSSIDVIFADPPYFMRTEGVLNRPEGSAFSGCDDAWDKFSDNEAYKAFSYIWLKEAKRILKPNGSIWVIGSHQCIYTIGAIMQDLGFWFINDVIWHKSNPTPNFLGTRLNNSHESLIWAAKDKKSKYTFHYKTAKELNNEIVGFEKGQRKQLGSVWRLPVCTGNERLKDMNGEKLHNTQKPEALLYRIIAINSSLGDVVCDPFGGTCTTAAVAKRLGRNFITIEKNSDYIQYAKKRLDSIIFEESDIAKASFDKKPLKVSLETLIEAGFLESNEKLYLKNTPFCAQLQSDGKAIFEGQSYDIHTLAAKLKQAKVKRLNGFMYWEVQRKNRISLYDIREQYRTKIKKTY